MTYAIPGSTPDGGGPIGETYGAALVRIGDESLVVDALRGIRFTGWVAPAESGWVVALGDPGDGTVATARSGVLEVGAALAAALHTVVVVARVRLDRQLVLAAFRGPDELGRYSSDPSREPGADDEVLAEPFGVEHAEAFAEAVGRADAAEELAEVLGEELDTDSVYESERLARVLGLLGLPRWIVAAGALPRDLPTGPRTKDLVRLGAGATGAKGVVQGRAAAAARRRMPPPPAIADPPRADDLGIDPWLL
ncbi:hypothetical protein AVP42_00868 [Agromyces sp. NDB4Y10]|uniref:hypothetical protein n=1 Tax=Agromyces sp. NDB4Y10 TaxID=1775951 RepID=UPI0007B2C492|nr:hypothetical protein [Agromyces sp. NDB4Y10]KZE94940.1 hypothetical protein AVP42_00868 [Agromyces sp. NDB4Y10]